MNRGEPARPGPQTRKERQVRHSERTARQKAAINEQFEVASRSRVESRERFNWDRTKRSAEIQQGCRAK